MKIACLVMWIIIFIVDTIIACQGKDPNWVLVYCPLVTVICFYMKEVAEEYLNKKNRGSH